MPHKSKIEAVIFDMDGIIIDSEPLWKMAEIAILNRYSLENTIKDRLLQSKDLRVDEIIKLWMQVASQAEIDLADLIDEINQMAKQLIEERCPMMPGVLEALSLCHHQGLKMGLISASPMNIIETVISTLKINHFFDAFISSEHLIHAKPHPEVYLEITNRLNVSPLFSISIEDTIDGMIAAKAARMRSIIITPEEGLKDPRFKLADIHLTTLLNLSIKHIS